MIYVKAPAPDREARLKELLAQIRSDDTVSYKPFTSAAELSELVENDLMMLLTERFETPTNRALPAVRQLGRFIDSVYNKKRIHSSLGYLTPTEFEAHWRSE